MLFYSILYCNKNQQKSSIEKLRQAGVSANTLPMPNGAQQWALPRKIEKGFHKDEPLSKAFSISGSPKGIRLLRSPIPGLTAQAPLLSLPLVILALYRASHWFRAARLNIFPKGILTSFSTALHFVQSPFPPIGGTTGFAP